MPNTGLDGYFQGYPRLIRPKFALIWSYKSQQYATITKLEIETKTGEIDIRK